MKLLLTTILSLLCTYANIQSDSPKIPYNLVTGLPDILISPLSEKIGHTWANGNVYEKHLIQKFYSLLASKNNFSRTAENQFLVVLDIGAQTGSFSLLAKYFPHSQWYAFEPLEEAA